MGKFFISGETHRVTFEDGEWCDIKAEFTQEDFDYITNAMVRGSILPGAKKSEVDISMQFGKRATLERAIVAWSFKDGDSISPLTPENISNLRTKYRVVLIAEIDQLTKEANQFSKN